MRRKWKTLICTLLILALVASLLPGALAAEADSAPMYRLYNPNSGEHFYTGSTEERDMLTDAGWNYEGIAWNSPIAGGIPVHRTYNPNSGDHHYTTDQAEVDMLVRAGWDYEGVAWNSADNGVIQFRLWNPNADLGSHHYTSSSQERDILIHAGWILEGIGWYSLAGGGHIHDYDYTVVIGNCQQTGYTEHTCACGDSYQDNITPAVHAWSEWTVTKKATFFEEGSQTHTCINCEITETEVIPVEIFDADAIVAHGREYAASLGFIIDPNMNKDVVCGYYPALAERLYCMEDGYEAVEAAIDYTKANLDAIDKLEGTSYIEGGCRSNCEIEIIEIYENHPYYGSCYYVWVQDYYG